MRKAMNGVTAAAAAVTFGALMALVGVAAPRAHAADLPVYVPPPPPVWSWTGPYAGLHVGTVDGDVDDDFDTLEQSSNGDAMDPNGVMGGLQAGYNFQFDSIVLGVEGDISFGDVDDVIYPVFGGSDSRVEPQIDWMATIRARLGWAMDRTLFYATGGVAFTDLKIKVDFEGFPGSASEKNSYFGWTVGGGVEHAWTDNISFKAEYLYADFGKENFEFFNIEEDDFLLEGDAKLKTHTFRVGVNWLF